MKKRLDEWIAKIRKESGLTVLAGYPDGAAVHTNSPVVAVVPAGVRVRAAGLGETDLKLAEITFEVTVFDPSAEQCVRAAAPLPLILPGPVRASAGAVFDKTLKRYALTYAFTETVLLESDAMEDDDILAFDWKGEITHECDA